LRLKNLGIIAETRSRASHAAWAGRREFDKVEIVGYIFMFRVIGTGEER
jgi:hypothetical protein